MFSSELHFSSKKQDWETPDQLFAQSRMFAFFGVVAAVGVIRSLHCL
jgi:hypothetical protein